MGSGHKYDPSQMEQVAARLGHRPIDCDPGAVRTYADTCAGIGSTVDQLLPGLRAAAAATDAQDSEAVAELGHLARKVTGRLATVGQRYGAIGTVLTTYAGALDPAQAQSWQAYDEAVAALGVLVQLKRDLDRHVTDIDPQAPTPSTPGWDVISAGVWARACSWDGHEVHLTVGSTEVPPRDGWERTQVDLMADQYRKIDAAGTKMQGAWDTLGTAATTAVNALKALHDDGLDDGLRDNAAGWGHALHLDDIGSAIKAAWDWLYDHLDAINTIVGIAALVLCWVPVVGQVLAVAAAVLSAAVLIRATIEAARGYGSWGDVGLAAIGVVTFGAGRAASAGIKATRALTGTARGASETFEATSTAANGLARGAAAESAAGQSGKSVTRQVVESLSPQKVWSDARQVTSDQSSNLAAAYANAEGNVVSRGVTAVKSTANPQAFLSDGWQVNTFTASTATNAFAAVDLTAWSGNIVDTTINVADLGTIITGGDQ